MKYLCIDTNIFIQCCLLEIEEGDDIKALQDLHKLLNESKITLLLPEVIELEFYKVLEQKTEDLKKKIGFHKANINKDNFDNKIKNDILDKLDQVLSGREENKKKVIKEIGEIFSHKNTTKIPLNADSFFKAYKFFLKGKKPYLLGKSEAIDSDSLIIQLLSDFLQGKQDYEFYFCSGNYTDFAVDAKIDLTNHHPEVHQDIKDQFTNVEYYVDLLHLLNEKFGGSYSEETIEKLKEKGVDQGININQVLSPSVSPSDIVSPSPSPSQSEEMIEGSAPITDDDSLIKK